MPTPTGSETISERLTRLRAELARVRTTIATAETNGSQFSIQGATITQIAYERALARAAKLEEQIRTLVARRSGSPARSGIALTRTRMPSAS